MDHSTAYESIIVCNLNMYVSATFELKAMDESQALEVSTTWIKDHFDIDPLMRNIQVRKFKTGTKAEEPNVYIVAFAQCVTKTV